MISYLSRKVILAEAMYRPKSNEQGFAETMPGEKGLSTIRSGWNELEIEVFVGPDAPRLALPAPPTALALTKSTCLLQAYQ